MSKHAIMSTFNVNRGTGSTISRSRFLIGREQSDGPPFVTQILLVVYNQNGLFCQLVRYFLYLL